MQVDRNTGGTPVPPIQPSDWWHRLLASAQLRGARGMIARPFRTALSFMTRLPIRAAPGPDLAIGRAVAFFPVVGLILGLLLAVACVPRGRTRPCASPVRSAPPW